ncbi:MAG: hypothetical protein MUF71_02330 [Candidatus Kapabacteria bacterium]|jgi:hypothetical protein|nr:hypothetical protein [Candidatus Kapabacteria bacterium]
MQNDDAFSKQEQSQQEHSSSTNQSSNNSYPDWWNAMLSRRQMNTNLAALAAAAGVTGFLTSCDDDDVESESDTLELQRKEGWNVGSQDKTLTFKDKQVADSTSSSAWKDFTKPDVLLKAWQPRSENAKWQPYYVPTLIQSLSQDTLRGVIAPICTPAMREAYSRGLGMREVLKTCENPASTLIIADISGPEAVAFAAAMSDLAEPVISFDNFPHPLGVVPSHETLAALVYYAKEVSEKAEKRPAKPAAVLVLDANRLAKYVDADNQFDNRYMAKIPTAENLTALNINAVVYGMPNETQKTEMDDLNDDFVAYQEKNITVEMLPLTRFQAAAANASTGSSTATVTAQNTQNLQQQPQQNLQQQNLNPQAQQNLNPQMAAGYSTMYAPPVYYYGGGPMYSPWFFYHYPTYTYYRTMPVMSRLPATSYTRSSYMPTRRPTLFSGRSVGGVRSGIGRQRPSGFGRVSVRTSASTGRLSGIRSGRSGSFGRSSFGGRSS